MGDPIPTVPITSGLLSFAGEAGLVEVIVGAATPLDSPLKAAMCITHLAPFWLAVAL